MSRYIIVCTAIISLMICFTLESTVQAQNKDKQTWITGFFGHQEYDGDLGNELLEFGIGSDWAGGLSVDQYVTPYFDMEFSFTYGSLDYKNFGEPSNPLKRWTQFYRNFVNMNALLKFKPLREPHPVQPFVGTGFGFTPVWGETSRIESVQPLVTTDLGTKDVIAFQIPLKIGADFRLAEDIYATANATYNRTFSDGIDGRGAATNVDGKDHDDFIVYSVGIKMSLQSKTDSDGDGLPDREDACPNRSGNTIDGCPDRDNDGIKDREDQCPGIPGTEALNGCPDADGDGIEDNRDACPNAAGTEQNKGCPDSDGDGIIDRNDRCPNTAGDQNNQGCPIPPDSDNDGIADPQDNCPNQQGPASNNGCPEEREVKEEVKKEIQQISENLFFNSASSRIQARSYDVLNRLAEIMVKEKDLGLIIRGHTDSIGDAHKNLVLSVERANSVKQYLVDKGISPDRITAFGYGETIPIASNETAAGRQKNRRVELELFYRN